MNLKFLLQIGLVLTMGFSLSSCLKDQCQREVTYVTSTPIYMTKDEIREGSLTNEAPRSLKSPTQFYYYQDHIFIVERGEGIHVIDNTSPESPAPIAFLKVPGAEQLAIKNALLYTNNYIDLLTIDITDIHNAKLVKRSEDIFPPIWEDVNSGQVLVEYELDTLTEVMECFQYNNLISHGGFFFEDDRALGLANSFAFDATSFGPATTTATSATTGVGGSMARFTVVGDYLYTVDQSSLNVISLQNPNCPEYVRTENLGWGIETIIPHGEHLFIGSESGMFIFDNSNPEAPTQLAVFQHARACDPVFVKDDYAYVTLRDGNTCAGFFNQLDLVDISNLESPFLQETFPMQNPHGLTIRDNHLFVCEGAGGIKAFDIEDPKILDEKLLDHFDDFDAFDAISLPGSRPITIVIGDDGFYQFEFRAERFELISKIDIDAN